MTSPSLTLTAVTIEFAEANMAGLATLLGFPATDIAYGSFASGVSMVVAYGTTASTIHETVPRCKCGLTWHLEAWIRSATAARCWRRSP